MNKSMQIAFFCLVAASAVFARPGYLGYPYAGAAGPYAAGIHGAPLPVHDTPEVAAAKAAHFAAYNAAASAAAAAPDTGAYDGAYGGPYAGGAYAGGAYGGAYGGPYAGGAYAGGAYGAAPYAAAPYAGLYAGAPAIVHGVPADTPEVAAAKAAHFAAHAKAAHHYG